MADNSRMVIERNETFYRLILHYTTTIKFNLTQFVLFTMQFKHESNKTSVIIKTNPFHTSARALFKRSYITYVRQHMFVFGIPLQDHRLRSLTTHLTLTSCYLNSCIKFNIINVFPPRTINGRNANCVLGHN